MKKKCNRSSTRSPTGPTSTVDYGIYQHITGKTKVTSGSSDGGQQARMQIDGQLMSLAHLHTQQQRQVDEIVLTAMQSRAAFNATSDTSRAILLSVMESTRKFSGGCPGS